MEPVAREAPELKFIEVAEHGSRLKLAVWVWPGGGRPLLFAHATGFHGRCWDEVARAFPGRRRLALDFRAHGRSGRPQAPLEWPWFGRDVTAVAEEFGFQDAIGVGHSMGGHALVSSVAVRPDSFAALLLIDPVILPPEHYGARSPRAEFIRRRRARWSGPEEMFENFKTRPPFRGWRTEVLRDYCDYGLVPEDGEFALACPPQLEASIYDHSHTADASLYAEIPAVRMPVTVLRADAPAKPGTFDPGASPTWPELASRFPLGKDVLLKGRNHYIPMESPELVVNEIEQLERRDASRL